MQLFPLKTVKAATVGPTGIERPFVRCGGMFYNFYDFLAAGDDTCTKFEIFEHIVITILIKIFLFRPDYF